MKNMTRIPVTADDLDVVAGPSYMEHTEDGPQSRFDYFVVYHNREKDGLTLDKSFARSYAAEQMMQRIVEHGSINPQKWTKGDPWWSYHRGMSLQERYAPFGPAWQEEQR